MSYLPPEKPKKDKNAISGTRVVLWVVVGGIGVWMIGSGIVGMITAG